VPANRLATGLADVLKLAGSVHVARPADFIERLKVRETGGNPGKRRQVVALLEFNTRHRKMAAASTRLCALSGRAPGNICRSIFPTFRAFASLGRVESPVPACVFDVDRVRLPVSRNAFHAAFPSKRRVFSRQNCVLRSSEPWRVRQPRFVVTFKSSIALIQNSPDLFSGWRLMQYVKHVRYAAHYTARSAAFPPVQNDNGTHRT
jgi:hypothetical protein